MKNRVDKHQQSNSLEIEHTRKREIKETEKKTLFQTQKKSNHFNIEVKSDISQ